MGKKITFIGFLLALLCLVPAGIDTLLGGDDAIGMIPGLIALAGFPLFALVSFIGMILWTVAEIRRGPSSPRDR